MKGRNFQSMIALLVFLLFVLGTLLVLITGAGAYRRMVDSGEQRYLRFTASRYVATRVHQSQQVWVEDFQGCQALSLGETIQGERYVTRVYLYDGYLRELFCLESDRLDPEDGERILPASRFSLSLSGSLLTVSLEADDLYLYIPTGEGNP